MVASKFKQVKSAREVKLPLLTLDFVPLIMKGFNLLVKSLNKDKGAHMISVAKALDRMTNYLDNILIDFSLFSTFYHPPSYHQQLRSSLLLISHNYSSAEWSFLGLFRRRPFSWDAFPFQSFLSSLFLGCFCILYS